MLELVDLITLIAKRAEPKNTTRMTGAWGRTCDTGSMAIQSAGTGSHELLVG